VSIGGGVGCVFSVLSIQISKGGTVVVGSSAEKASEKEKADPKATFLFVSLFCLERDQQNNVN
jgi:hypothetical protein